MYTKREAAHLLGIDRNTLTKWARACGIRDGEDPRDKRLSLLSDEDLRKIRERYADMHIFGTSSANRQHTDSVSSADLATRVAAMEATIERLQQRWPHLFAETRHRAPQVSAVELPAYDPPRRLAATTVRHSHTPAHPQVPPQLMALPTWARLHGIAQGTVEHWRDVGKLPTVRGTWLEGKTRVSYVLTAEGREIAHQLAHQLADLPWPCEHCSTEDNEAQKDAPSY